MAQSAEHILGKDEVPGSNPGISSSKKALLPIRQKCFFATKCALRHVKCATRVKCALRHVKRLSAIVRHT